MKENTKNARINVRSITFTAQHWYLYLLTHLKFRL